MPVPYKNEPGFDIIPVTPHDTNDLTVLSRGDELFPVRALLIGGAGALKIDTINGQTRTITNAPVGILPVGATRVYSTGTTATYIAAIY